MTHPRLRLAVAVFLFLGWIGYLLFLVVRTRNPVILSRPQLLETDVVVLAALREENGKPHPEAAVTDILWALDGSAKPEIGNTLRLPELVDSAEGQGWRGPGEYLIPLRVMGAKERPAFAIPAIPWSPGFSPLWQVEIENQTSLPKDLLQWIEQKTSLRPDDWKQQTKEPIVLKRNLTKTQADDLEKEVRALGGAARARLGEYRIYLATDDAKEQLKSIMAR